MIILNRLKAPHKRVCSQEINNQVNMSPASLSGRVFVNKTGGGF